MTRCGAAPSGLIVIPVLFLVGGLLTPPSVQRKGVQRHVRDRLVRPGVPHGVREPAGKQILLHDVTNRGHDASHNANVICRPLGE
jgi:hypothetical protein